MYPKSRKKSTHSDKKYESVIPLLMILSLFPLCVNNDLNFLPLYGQTFTNLEKIFN